jgi:hypothetical protein
MHTATNITLAAALVPGSVSTASAANHTGHHGHAYATGAGVAELGRGTPGRSPAMELRVHDRSRSKPVR